MKFFGYEIRKATKSEVSHAVYPAAGRVNLMSRSKPMLLSAVYRCVDLISDSLAVLPLRVYEVDRDGFKREAKEHPLHWLLNNEPNGDMTRYTWLKTLQSSILLHGNGYAYIDRDRRYTPSELLILQDEDVKVKFIDQGDGILRKRYQVKGWKDLVEPADMIHVLNFTYNGLWGVSTLTHAAQSLRIATAQDENTVSFFESGSSLTGVLTVETGGTLSKERKDQIYKTWKDRVSDGGSGGIAVLEGNMKYQPITISNRDSQMLESRQFSVVDICRFFSVSPVKAFDLSHSSYSTVEATQLQYLSDTLLPVITKWEQELNRKLFTGADRGRYVCEFDTTTLLRADKSAQAAWLQTMFNVGSFTPNEIRREANLPKVEGGDKTFVQVNLQTLDKAVSTEPANVVPQP